MRLQLPDHTRRTLCIATTALLPLLGAALPGCDEDDPAPPRLYRVEDGLMKDQTGHVLLLRGLNVSGQAKGTPDHLFDLQPSDVDTMLAGGVNVARLLTFWKAITPEAPGAVDAAYLAAYRQRVDQLTAAGLYVVVDMHQDVWGVPFAPHGAPAWACPEELTEGYEPASPWWLNYTTPQVRGCFDHFWSTPALEEAFIAAWVAVAGAVCDEERVLGFDLLNEPYPGSALFEPDWDNDVLLPFYLRVAAAIEAVCPGRLYFLEPSAGYVLGMAAPMQFPDAHRDRLVYAGHYYPNVVHESGTEGYDGDATALAADVWGIFGPYLEDGVPVWLGEWGGISSNPNFGAYVDDVSAVFAAHNMSATLWDYYRGDGGFAYLDDAGQRKPAFDRVFGSPMLTRLPGPPTVTLAPAARQVAAQFTCRAGAEATVLLPTAGCACEAAPAGSLSPFPTGPGFVTATCAGAAAVTLTCACPP